MKLDTVRQSLRDVLSAFEQGRAVPIDPNLVEDIIWFLDLLRKREGYDIERPVRRERSHDKNPFENETAWQQSQRQRYNKRDSEFSWRSKFDQEYARDFQTHAQKIFEEFLRGDFGRGFHREYEQAPEDPPPPPTGKRAWFVVLGVNPDANLAERLAAYRRKAMECHPDRGGTTEQMQELNRAREEAGV